MDKAIGPFLHWRYRTHSVLAFAGETVRHNAGAGDSFVMPEGWRGIWHMPTLFKNLFVFIDVAKPRPDRSSPRNSCQFPGPV